MDLVLLQIKVHTIYLWKTICRYTSIHVRIYLALVNPNSWDITHGITTMGVKRVNQDSGFQFLYPYLQCELINSSELLRFSAVPSRTDKLAHGGKKHFTNLHLISLFSLMSWLGNYFLSWFSDAFEQIYF